MLRTKYLVIISAISLSVGVCAAAYVWFSYGGQLVGTRVTELVPADTTDDLEWIEVSVIGRKDTSEVRADLLEALRNNQITEDEFNIAIEADEAEAESDEEAEKTTGLALGDGNISTSPQIGYIYACQQQFNGGGAYAAGEWIQGDEWFPENKVVVDGAVTWPNDISITKAEGARLFVSNGLPNHPTGNFPITATDDAYQYDRNPNQISSQNVLLQVSAMPVLAMNPACLPMGMIGISLNGTAIYNGLDGQGLDAAAHEIQDSCGGHPERSGEYHYHNESNCLYKGYYEGAESTLLGYALDGFGIFASQEYGETLVNEDLDACHGHTHSIPWDGVYTSLYHYHMTQEYPYTLGCFMGAPASVTSQSTETTPTEPPAPAGQLPPPNGQNPPPPGAPRL